MKKICKKDINVSVAEALRFMMAYGIAINVISRLLIVVIYPKMPISCPVMAVIQLPEYVIVTVDEERGNIMKRYRVSNNVEIESKTGRFALAEECFDVQARSDGLWLHTPEINGKRCAINLTNPNGLYMLLELWKQLYNQSEKDIDK